MKTMTGNHYYRDIVRRLPIVMPTLDVTMLDRAIADLGATPETVTEDEMRRALRAVAYPILAARKRSAITTPTQAGLITTDAEDRVASITAVAATLVGLDPGTDATGQPVQTLPGVSHCVPSVRTFSDVESVQIAECVISTDGRRVQCVSHLRIAGDGSVLGVSTTVQDITLQTALFDEVVPLYRANETRAEDLAAFAEIARLIALTTSLDATLAAITERAARRVGCLAVAIFLPDALGHLRLMGQYGLPVMEQYGLPGDYASMINAYMRDAIHAPDDEQPPTTLAFRDGIPVHRRIRSISDDAPEGAHAARRAAVAGGWDAIVSVPLIAKETTIGVMTCYFATAEPPNDETLRRITTIADHAAIAVQNSKLYAEIERQLAEMTALHRSAALLNSSLDRTAVLNTIVEQAALVTGARVCGLLELSASGDATIPRAVYGVDAFPFSDGSILRHGPALYVMQQREPLIVRNHDEAKQMPWWRADFAEHLDRATYKAFIAVPFGYQGARDAALMLVYDHPINPSASELQLISTFAEHAAVALHNVRLYEQAREAAALAERHRLARDLHDSVTQSLFSMSLLAQVLPTLWELQPEEAKQSLGELRRLSKEALAEMRALLFQLRPVALEEDGLVEALTKHIESLQRRDGPALTFAAGEADARLPLPVEETLFRVASEAVSNALKHAHAQKIAVTLDRTDGITLLQVRDDGRGFVQDGQRAEPGHLGLSGMRERVAQIDGILRIESAPGAGTTVTVRVAAAIVPPQPA